MSVSGGAHPSSSGERVFGVSGRVEGSSSKRVSVSGGAHPSFSVAYVVGVSGREESSSSKRVSVGGGAHPTRRVSKHQARGYTYT